MQIGPFHCPESELIPRVDDSWTTEKGKDGSLPTNAYKQANGAACTESLSKAEEEQEDMGIMVLEGKRFQTPRARGRAMRIWVAGDYCGPEIP